MGRRQTRRMGAITKPQSKQQPMCVYLRVLVRRRRRAHSLPNAHASRHTRTGRQAGALTEFARREAGQLHVGLERQALVPLPLQLHAKRLLAHCAAAETTPREHTATKR